MNNIIKKSVIILGAGPAGLAAALKLSYLNIDCICIEKYQFPRDKICGDALSGKVVTQLKQISPEIPSLLKSEEMANGCWGIRFYAPDMSSLNIPFKKDFLTKGTSVLPSGFVMPRYDFDNFLYQIAIQKKEISFLQNIGEYTIAKNNENFQLKNDDFEIEAPLLIDCSGAQSRFVRDYLQQEVEKEHHCAGLRVYYEGISFTSEGNFLELYFLKNLLPGYFWIFPLKNGRANVGLGMQSAHVSKHKINLKQKLEEIIKDNPELKERFKNAIALEKPKGFGLPLGSKKRRISGHGYMLCGDAASLIDPFTGEGISNALCSGILAASQAAECIHQQRFDATFMGKYDQAVYKKLGAELQLSYWLQKMVTWPRLFNFLVRKANSNDEIKLMMTSMFDNVDLRKKLTSPSFYLKLLWNK